MESWAWVSTAWCCENCGAGSRELGGTDPAIQELTVGEGDEEGDGLGLTISMVQGFLTQRLGRIRECFI